MKRIVIVILITILVAPFLMKSYTYFDYYISIDTIIEKFCENKDKPEMQCNGKCYLNKQVAVIDGVNMNQEKSPNPKSPTPENVDTSLYFILHNLAYATNNTSENLKNKIHSPFVGYSFLYSPLIYSPPKFQNA
jgi:hypothetical protein